jgi:hypothetical protein
MSPVRRCARAQEPDVRQFWYSAKHKLIDHSFKPDSAGFEARLLAESRKSVGSGRKQQEGEEIYYLTVSCCDLVGPDSADDFFEVYKAEIRRGF